MFTYWLYLPADQSKHGRRTMSIVRHHVHPGTLSTTLAVNTALLIWRRFSPQTINMPANQYLRQTVVESPKGEDTFSFVNTWTNGVF